MEIIEGFELSPQQKHLWKLQYSSPNLPYRAQCIVEIKGQIESNTLKSAIEQVISNHEILRTSFNDMPGMTLPLQAIAPDCTFNFSEYDYSGIELEAQLAQIELLWENYNQLPFDFSQNLLFHCAFVTLSQSESVLLLNLPALYIDTKGLDNLVFKIGDSYHACTKGKQLVDEVLQYADISEWQNQLLQDEKQKLILAKGYWREQKISDCLNITLPFERHFDEETGFEPRYLNFMVSPSQVQQILEFIQKEKISIDLFFLTCWQILLWRITQQSEVLVGVGCEGRNHEELQNSIGLLAKYSPLKSSLKEGLLFQDVLKQIQLNLDSINTWQEQFTWDLIIDEKKNDINTPFIPFSFDFIKLDNYIFDNICFSISKHDVCFDKFKIKLSFTQNQDDLLGQLYYDANLFEQAYIQCLVEQFQTLLSSLLDCPITVIDKIAILNEVEREKILYQFNNTSSDYPKDKCIHFLFEEQVEKTPNAIAVVFEEEQLTYQELNERANQLAHYLQSLGVKPEVLVGICVERSVDMVVGLLGILKAGGAYVPLDPNYPIERLSYMLSDSDIGVLVTQNSLLESLPEHDAEVVCLDSDWGVISQQSLLNIDVGVSCNNLAYVIYTSGSTGQPKGVLVEHHSVLNLTESLYQAIYAKLQNSPLKISWNGSFSFDTSVKQLIQLVYGNTLDILPTMVRFDGDALLSYLQDHKIEVFDCTPSQLELLISAGLLVADDVPSCVLIGGEAITPSHWQALNQVKSIKFYNLYGPTECTVDATLCNLRISDNQPLIGRPISNTQIYILDSNLQPVPVGVPGELYIGGDGLARGYLNRPQLTSEKFIPNPFNSTSKLYKTGDKARYLSDGNIEFIGRIDNQVKIRGFRIELGEIEAVLTTHPQCLQTVVIASEENTGNKRLIAYVVTDSAEITTAQLREYLKAQLPDYMIPSAFVTLDNLPLTPNGKIDRQALPAPDITERETEYIAPRTQTELQLTQIWSSVLNIPQVGVKDNFFSLGGHSLLAVRLMSEIQKQFHINLPLAILFQSPTIEQLALALGSNVSSQLWSPLVPIQPNGSLPPLFCVPGTGGNVLGLHHCAKYIGNNQPLYGLQAQGLDGETEPYKSVEEIAQQHIKAIQTIQPTGPYFLAGHSFGGKVVFEMANQLQCMGESVAYVGILDASAPIKNLNHQDDFSNWDDARWICKIASLIQEFLGENLVLDYQTLASLSSEQQLNYFQEQLEEVGFLPPQTDIKLVRGLVQVYQTQCQIKYEPQNSYSAPITLFRVREVDEEQQNSSTLYQEPTRGWNQFSSSEVEVHIVPGNHISMMNEPHVKVLAEKMQQSLELAHGVTSSLKKSEKIGGDNNIW